MGCRRDGRQDTVAKTLSQGERGLQPPGFAASHRRNAARGGKDVLVFIKQVELVDFRGFRRVTIALDRQLTVLVGPNGAGKTTVLDALALLLDQYAARLVASPNSARRMVWSDTRLGSAQTRIRIVVDREGRETRWTLSKQGSQQKILNPIKSDLGSLRELVQEIASASVTEKFLEGQALPVYYDQRRALIDFPRRKRAPAKHEARDAFVESRAPGGVDFRAFTYWFAERETEELRRQKRDRRYSDPQLKAVRRAIKTGTGFSDPTYRIEAPRGLCVTKGKKELHVEQLSTGEKAFVALAGDLARRLAMVASAGRDPLQERAIVLIDEVELHLHPRWQRTILPWMLKTFPRCQFVVSTHSAQVIGEVAAHSIRVLAPGHSGNEVSGAEASLGRDSNYILLRARLESHA